MAKDTFAFLAKALNKLAAKFRVALRLEFITPDDADRQLKENPRLLREHHRSQMMAGDKTEEDVLTGKSRPLYPVLVERIKTDRWRWYFGVINRCLNGAVIDGVTRLLAIRDGGKGVWVLAYNAADPEDATMYDDADSARSAKDIFAGLRIPANIAAILSVMVPKAAGSAEETGTERSVSWKRLNRDRWVAFYEQFKQALEAAATFVMDQPDVDPMVRQNLAAYIYFKFVSSPKAVNPEGAEKLLTIYRTGLGVVTKVDRQMVDLRHFFQTNNHLLHERNQAMPLFIRVMKTALTGDVLKYDLVSEKSRNGGRTYRIKYEGDKPKKKVAKVKAVKSKVNPAKMPLVEIINGKPRLAKKAAAKRA